MGISTLAQQSKAFIFCLKSSSFEQFFREEVLEEADERNVSSKKILK